MLVPIHPLDQERLVVEEQTAATHLDSSEAHQAAHHLQRPAAVTAAAAAAAASAASADATASAQAEHESIKMWRLGRPEPRRRHHHLNLDHRRHAWRCRGVVPAATAAAAAAALAVAARRRGPLQRRRRLRHDGAPRPRGGLVAVAALLIDASDVKQPRTQPQPRGLRLLARRRRRGDVDCDAQRAGGERVVEHRLCKVVDDGGSRPPVEVDLARDPRQAPHVLPLEVGAIGPADDLRREDVGAAAKVRRHAELGGCLRVLAVADLGAVDPQSHRRGAACAKVDEYFARPLEPAPVEVK